MFRGAIIKRRRTFYNFLANISPFFFYIHFFKRKVQKEISITNCKTNAKLLVQILINEEQKKRYLRTINISKYE